ncbi:MAG: tetratricopeptide repeat protein [Candidatus Krumholzibacteriia bacterium]
MTRSATVGASMVLALALAVTARADPLEEGLARYRQNELEQAVPLFREAVQQNPADPDAHAWLAETLRRLHDPESAVRHAREAIALEACHSFAHTVVADTYNPQYSSWWRSHADSTWSHLLRAVACDSADGNAWFGIWSEAIRRGRRDLEVAALRAIVETAFLAPALMAYNRWVLRNLPENALLLTNGDMDTYPVLGLQVVEQMREDVAVVNVSMLNLGWYRRAIQERYSLPAVSVDSLIHVPLNKQAIASWMEQQENGTFPRPMTVATTVLAKHFGPRVRDRFQLAGPHWLCLREKAESLVDTTLIRRSLESVVPEEFTGPWVGPGIGAPCGSRPRTRWPGTSPEPRCGIARRF